MSKANRTRMELQEAAIRLFTERGYDNTTVEDIAHEASVSHMTFFRNFATKASVLFDDPYDPVIGVVVAEVDPALPPLERVRQGLLNAWSNVDGPEDAVTRTRFRIITQDEGLVAKAWSNNRKTEQVIVDALTDTGVDLLDARVAAGAVMGALMAALIDWGQDDESGPLGQRVTWTLEQLAPSSQEVSDA